MAGDARRFFAGSEGRVWERRHPGATAPARTCEKTEKFRRACPLRTRPPSSRKAIPRARRKASSTSGSGEDFGASVNPAWWLDYFAFGSHGGRDARAPLSRAKIRERGRLVRFVGLIPSCAPIGHLYSSPTCRDSGHDGATSAILFFRGARPKVGGTSCSPLFERALAAPVGSWKLPLPYGAVKPS
jgi:hypothetical protein